jgi:endonuclease/exonuclease/phosphatase family metal-dependent hydrolase
MRVVTWNCNLQLAAKFSSILALDADIYFLQECENLPSDHFPGFTFHWGGNTERKGLGILTKEQSEFYDASYNPSLTYFLPVKIDDLLLINVWAFNGRASKFGEDSSGYLLDALNHYKELIKGSAHLIVAGDFNNGPQWDRPGHKNNFKDINQSLNELGLHSAYHQFSGESFGEESKGTHFHQRNPDKPFHIDYIYSTLNAIRSVEVGSFSDWSKFSDHVPVTAEFQN